MSQSAAPLHIEVQEEPDVIGRMSILFLTVGLFAQAAAAQTISLSPPNPKRWDTSVTIGWLGGEKGEIGDRWNEWYDTLATSIDVGRYWTPHVKTEASLTLTSEGDIYSVEQFAVPGQRSPVFFSREHLFRLRSLNLSGAYQLLENSWVHPYVGAGIQLAAERHRVETPFPGVFGPDGRGPIPLPPLADTDDTTFLAHPFLTGGAKFYFTEQGFIRTDLSAAFDGRGAARVWWRIGAGLDF